MLEPKRAAPPSLYPTRRRDQTAVRVGYADAVTTISWRSIEHGWEVFGSDGERIGVVFLVVGDENGDIFDGLAITAHGGPFVFHNYADRPHYVPAEQVVSIDPGRVALSITADDAAHLPVHDAPESAIIEPESASRLKRVETWFEHTTGEDRTE